jgi:hypothetical protein
VKNKLISASLAVLICGLGGVGVPAGALADDSRVLDWLRSRGDDRSEARSRFGDWLRSRREGRSGDRSGFRDWLRARGGDGRDRDWDWSDWRRRFRDDSPFAEFHRHRWDDRDRSDYRDRRSGWVWPYLGSRSQWYGDDRYPYGDYWRRSPWYGYGYGRYPYAYGREYYDDYDDRDDYDEVWPWLAFTAIAWKVLDNLNEDQQRQHEMALSRATTVPVGETVRWRSGSAEGAVTPVREAARGPGSYCREFRQDVMIGERKESAFGTACRMPDGTWRMDR